MKNKVLLNVRLETPLEFLISNIVNLELTRQQRRYCWEERNWSVGNRSQVGRRSQVLASCRCRAVSLASSVCLLFSCSPSLPLLLALSLSRALALSLLLLLFPFDEHSSKPMRTAPKRTRSVANPKLRAK
jgi:hypothetical protein